MARWAWLCRGGALVLYSAQSDDEGAEHDDTPEFDGVRWKSLGHPTKRPLLLHLRFYIRNLVRFVVCQTLYRTELTGFSVLITFYYDDDDGGGGGNDATEEEDVCLSRISINQSAVESDSYYAKSNPNPSQHQVKLPPHLYLWTRPRPFIHSSVDWSRWCSVRYCCWIITTLLISPAPSAVDSTRFIIWLPPDSHGAKSTLYLVARFVERFNKSQMFMSLPPKKKHHLQVVIPCL